MKDTLGIILPTAGDSSDLAPLLGSRTLGTLPFGGRYRLIDFNLSNMVNSGISKVGVIGSVKYSSIVDHLGTGKEWLLSRKTNDLAILTGSVNARIGQDFKINLLDFILNRSYFDRFDNDTVVIAAPNIVTTFDFNAADEIFRKNDADVCLIYRPTHATFHTVDSDVFLELDGHRVTELCFAKDGKTDAKYADMLIIKKSVLEQIIEKANQIEEYDLMAILKDNLDTFKVYGWQHEGYINRVVDIEKYHEANMDLLNYDVLNELFMSEQPVYTKTKDNHPTIYQDNAAIKDCIVGSGCTIDGTLDNSILFREVTVETGSKISNSIIMQKCEIGKNVTLDHVIFDKEVKISDNASLIGTKDKPVILSKGTVI